MLHGVFICDENKAIIFMVRDVKYFGSIYCILHVVLEKQRYRLTLRNLIFCKKKGKSERTFIIVTEAEFVDTGILLYFCLILKASVSISFGILSACGADLMKKEFKTIMMFSSVLCGRFFLLNAPVIVSLGSFYGEYLSLTLFATLGVIGGFSMISIDLSKK